MAGFGDEFEAGAGDAFGDGAAVGGGDEAVVGAVDDEGWHFDAGQAAVGIPHQNAAELTPETASAPVALRADAKVLLNQFHGRRGRIQEWDQGEFAFFTRVFGLGQLAGGVREAGPTG